MLHTLTFLPHRDYSVGLLWARCGKCRIGLVWGTCDERITERLKNALE